MFIKTTSKWPTWLIFVTLFSLWIANAYAGSVLSAGVFHVCAVKNDNSLICWGDNEYNQLMSPDGSFSQVSAGMYFNCALKTDGSVKCWGRDTAGETSPPPGQFIQVEAGGNHACALTHNGLPICWGNNSRNQLDFLPGPYQQLALGDKHSCGLKKEGTVACWGSNGNGQLTPPAEITFSSIIAGYVTTCGIKTESKIAICWGASNESYGYLTQIDFGLYINSLCGLKVDNTLKCPSMIDLPREEFSHVTVGGNNYSFACGIKKEGLVTCWGDNRRGRASPPNNIVLMQPDNVIIPSEEVSAVINPDLSLKIYKARYTTPTETSILWVDLIFAGENEDGEMFWKLENYGVVE